MQPAEHVANDGPADAEMIGDLGLDDAKLAEDQA